MACPFCEIPVARLGMENEFWVAMRDGYPVSEGHTLIIPRRHVATWLDLNTNEMESLTRLLTQTCEELRETHGPDGFNIGINDGEAAGQTVPHLHVHVIPRYRGDAPDPRGGVRWVLPEKAAYWDR